MNIIPIYELSWQIIFLLFISFSFIGWASEVTYVGFFSTHKFINRGFLHGPICPIYGVGGILILSLPQIILKSWILLFFSSMILCTIVEYFASWILEKLFHLKWWDYSKYRFNIHGRVCLLNSLLFGVLSVLIVYFVEPFILKFWQGFSFYWQGFFASALLIILILDLIVTVKELVDFTATMKKIKTFSENLRAKFEKEEWFLGETLQEKLNSVKEYAKLKKDQIHQTLLDRIEVIQNEKRPVVERFLNKFPSAKSRKFKDELNLLKQRFINKKE
ncbi:MAG: putative ABC transporter permease [Treponema sp.]|nr:putative ABC transporter permease [Treponema sp.]